MPFVSMSSMCGFHERRVSSFTPRKVGVSTWSSVLSPSFMATFSLGWRGRKRWPVSSLHWSEDPRRLPTVVPSSQIPVFCKQKILCIQMHSTRWDYLHVGFWRNVREAQPWCSRCTGKKVSVGEITPPYGTPRIFTLLHICPSIFLLLLICRVGSIGSVCTFLQKRHSQVSSAGGLHVRLYQKILSGQRKQKQPFSFVKGDEGQLLCLCASSIQSVWVTVFSVLLGMILIFCWSLPLKSLPRKPRREMRQWLLGSFLALFYFMDLDDGGFFHKGRILRLSWLAEERKECFPGSRSKVFDHVFSDTIWCWCVLALSLFNCYFNLFRGNGLLRHLSDVGCFCSWVSCSLTWLVLSLGRFYFTIFLVQLCQQLAASFE